MWHCIGKENDFALNSQHALDIGEVSVLVIRLFEGFRAIENKCSHQGKPLTEGCVRNGEIICPFHGARFQLTDGHPIGPPAFKPLNTFNIKVEKEKVYLSVTK